MGLKKWFSVLATVVMLGGVFAGAASAEQFRIAIMQDQAGAARKFKPLLDYLGEKGVDASFVAAQDYSAAASMFEKGEVDAMFSGSGVAGTFIIKDVAYPVVRPVGKDGYSTYWAVVLAPAGAKRFDGTAEYFRNKKVAFAGLASSGEFYFHSIPDATKVGATPMQAASHGAAIDVLSRGRADVAIVKNRVWDKEKDKYRNVIQVGEDQGENPDGTLIASKKADAATVKKVSDILLGVEADGSTGAQAVRDGMGVQGYIATTDADFSHTIDLLKKAGVTAAFDFKY